MAKIKEKTVLDFPKDLIKDLEERIGLSEEIKNRGLSNINFYNAYRMGIEDSIIYIKESQLAISIYTDLIMLDYSDRSKQITPSTIEFTWLKK